MKAYESYYPPLLSYQNIFLLLNARMSSCVEALKMQELIRISSKTNAISA